MKRSYYLAIAALLLAVATSCSQKRKADLLIFNATIYTVDNAFTVAQAMVIRDGMILATGSTDSLRDEYNCTESYDAGGRFIYPGLIDAHAHFMGYAMGLQTADLTGTKSWNGPGGVIDRLKAFAAGHPGVSRAVRPDSATASWLVGRGWDQNDWENKAFPDKTLLDSLFPGRPVILQRVDGHAAIVNQAALNAAGIKPGDKVAGGEIGLMTSGKELSGMLVDNAVGLVDRKVPSPPREEIRLALMQAEKNCFAMGLTTIDDCGLSIEAMEGLRSLQDAGDLRMRFYVMLKDETRSLEYLEKHGIIKTAKLNVRSIKVYGDGALGSRGACLLQPYADQPGHTGFLLSTRAHFDSIAARIVKDGLQMCTHAIGDSGNRTILQVYAAQLKGKNDLRWRIEHAQVIAAGDFALFSQYSIIPSVQPTHATSDMYWAAQRLGKERVKGAYAYKQLLGQNGWLPLGTDFPVEDISPFHTFHSAVFRRDEKEWPVEGFQLENALTREQALRGMTIWAARSNFEEQEKGSLETGKFADFILLDKDLMKVSSNEVLALKVYRTYSGGVLVYGAE